jgi:hypothetical protein
MRYGALILLALPAFAQIANRATPAAAAAPTGVPVAKQQQGALAKIPLSSFVQLERAFDGKLSAIGAGGEPIDLLGATRGIYLDGYGVVFTTEMGLIVTPTINPFNQTITDTQKTRVHSAKVSRLATLRQVVTEMARTVATNLGQVPENQQVVVAVRLAYSGWENTSGLPGLIVAKADRRSAVAGNIQIQEQ